MSGDDVGVAEDEDFPVFRNTAYVVPANGETCVNLNTKKKKNKIQINIKIKSRFKKTRVSKMSFYDLLCL